MPAPSQYLGHLETLTEAVEKGRQAGADGLITPEEWAAVWPIVEQSWRQALRLAQTKRLSDHIDNTGTVNKNMLCQLRAYERDYESLEVPPPGAARALAAELVAAAGEQQREQPGLEVWVVISGTVVARVASVDLGFLALLPGKETTGDCSQQSPVDLLPKPGGVIGLSA
ncbi:MAG TPA: hypothetical protein VF914_17670 [Chloroflexia bacterium]|jgi:hypothetical protein